MTTGLQVSGDPNSGPLPYRRKAWWGDDGKHFTLNGETFLKRNEYSMDLIVCSFSPDVYTHNNYMSSSSAPTFDTATIPPNFELNLVSKLSQKIKGYQVNLGTDLATIGQTTQMVATTAKRFVASIRAIRRGDIPSALRVLGSTPPKRGFGSKRVPPLTFRDAGSAWLELKYGWEPLLSDIYEIGKVLELKTHMPRKYQVEVQSFATSSYRYNVENVGGYYHKDEYYRKMIYHGVEVLSKPRTLGLDDPLSIVWEILPWSFVVDWFIPIGNYIEEYHQIPNFSGWHENITMKKVSFSAWESNPGNSLYGANISGSRVELRRLHPPEIVVPYPSFKGFEKSLSLAHMENALALLSQLISGKH